MTIYDELKARGLIAQVTDEEEIKEVINNGKATFYIGFDWTADNPTSDIPAATNSSSNRVISSRIIEDGSYLRLKNVTIGYTFPSKLVKKWKIDKARVYVAAQNLWTCTGYSGYDPEVSVRNSALTPGLDYSSYPRAYSVSFGVSLGF